MKKVGIVSLVSFLAFASGAVTQTNYVVVVSNIYNRIAETHYVTNNVKNTHVNYFYTNHEYTVEHQTLVVSKTNLTFNVDVSDQAVATARAQASAASGSAAAAAESATAAAGSATSAASKLGEVTSAAQTGVSQINSAKNSGVSQINSATSSGLSSINSRISQFDQYAGKMVTNINAISYQMSASVNTAWYYNFYAWSSSFGAGPSFRVDYNGVSIMPETGKAAVSFSSKGRGGGTPDSKSWAFTVLEAMYRDGYWHIVISFYNKSTGEEIERRTYYGRDDDFAPQYAGAFPRYIRGLEFDEYDGCTIILGSNLNNAAANSTRTTTLATLDDVLKYYDQIIGYVDNAGIGGLAAVARSGSYNDLIDKPSFSGVAFSGNYNDLINKPTLPTLYIRSSGGSSVVTEIHEEALFEFKSNHDATIGKLFLTGVSSKNQSKVTYSARAESFPDYMPTQLVVEWDLVDKRLMIHVQTSGGEMNRTSYFDNLEYNGDDYNIPIQVGAYSSSGWRVKFARKFGYDVKYQASMFLIRLVIISAVSRLK